MDKAILRARSRELELTEDQEYDLKKSATSVGQLYPILLSKDGEVIDGLHRKSADPSWNTLTLDHIDSEEKKMVARLVANFHRRHISRDEKAEWINALARIYQDDGLKVEGSKRKTEKWPYGESQGPNEIAEKICEVTGLARRTVMTYLSNEFKQKNYARPDPRSREKASEIILHRIRETGQRGEYPLQLLERFKEEYKEELLRSPVFRKEVLQMIPRSISQPKTPALVFDPFDEEHVRELQRLDPERVFPEPIRRGSTSRTRRKKDVLDPPEDNGYEPLGNLYPIFIKECPQCICAKCSHADTCIERVRPED